MWHSLLGYVIIRIEGFGLERMLNRMNKADIPVWNIRREGANSITAEIRAKHFFRLRMLRKGMRCRVRIIERHGMPFAIARLKCRKLLCAGVVAISVLLYAASTRIWVVSVSGCESVPVAVVLRALEEEGVAYGMARSGVFPIPIGSAVRNYDNRIAWAGVRVDGVVLHVQVKEAELIPELPDKSEPSDVVAAKDGIIEKITALNGKASVTRGDAVRQGDILIRGDITREDADQRLLVYAQGKAIAIVYYSFSYTKPPTEERLERTGESVEYRELSVAGYNVYKSEIPYTAYELAISRGNLVNGLILPVRLNTGAAYNLASTGVPISREEQIAEAMYEAEYGALLKIPKDAQILEKSAQTHENDDGSVKVTVQIRVREQIGVNRAIAY